MEEWSCNRRLIFGVLVSVSLCSIVFYSRIVLTDTSKDQIPTNRTEEKTDLSMQQSRDKTENSSDQIQAHGTEEKTDLSLRQSRDQTENSALDQIQADGTEEKTNLSVPQLPDQTENSPEAVVLTDGQPEGDGAIATLELARDQVTEQTKQKDETVYDSSSSSSPSDVLLLSYMRSGSTYTGSLLGRRKDTFYFFEALWKLTPWGYFRNNSKACVQKNIQCNNIFSREDVHTILEMFFKCDISRVFLQNYGLPNHVDFGGSPWMACRRVGLTNCFSHLRKMCLEAKHRVTKVLRMTSDLSRRVLQKFPNVKLIHLVRDPRAVIYSRMTTGWYNYLRSNSNASDVRYAAQGLCEKVAYDTEWSIKLTKEFPDRVKIVQYEDLLLNYPTSQICLHNFVGMDLPEAFEGKTGNAMKWRSALSWTNVEIIDAECKSVYKSLGYLPFQNEHDFKTSSTPSMDPVLPFQCTDATKSVGQNIT